MDNKYTEEDLLNVIFEVQNGETQTQAAANWGIPQSTLSDRLGGIRPKKHAHRGHQRLSPDQERFICEWTLEEEKAARAPSRKQLHGFAQSILIEAGDIVPLGVRWVDRFLTRNPDCHMKNSSLLEAERVRGSTRDVYEKNFRLYKEKLDEFNIIPTNIANIDEHGMQELETRATKVIGNSLTTKTYRRSSGVTTWVSIIECGTIEGKRLHPAIVFTRASLPGQ
jgi:hypothetical protein